MPRIKQNEGFATHVSFKELQDYFMTQANCDMRPLNMGMMLTINTISHILYGSGGNLKYTVIMNMNGEATIGHEVAPSPDVAAYQAVREWYAKDGADDAVLEVMDFDALTRNHVVAVLEGYCDIAPATLVSAGAYGKG